MLLFSCLENLSEGVGDGNRGAQADFGEKMLSRDGLTPADVSFPNTWRNGSCRERVGAFGPPDPFGESLRDVPAPS